MYRIGKKVVGEMCSRCKYPLGEMPSRGNSRSDKCLVGEMSNRGSVGQGIAQSGLCPDPVYINN